MFLHHSIFTVAQMDTVTCKGQLFSGIFEGKFISVDAQQFQFRILCKQQSAVAAAAQCTVDHPDFPSFRKGQMLQDPFSQNRDMVKLFTHQSRTPSISAARAPLSLLRFSTIVKALDTLLSTVSGSHFSGEQMRICVTAPINFIFLAIPTDSN